MGEHTHKPTRLRNVFSQKKSHCSNTIDGERDIDKDIDEKLNNPKSYCKGDCLSYFLGP